MTDNSESSAEIDAGETLTLQESPISPDGAGPTNATHVVPQVISTNLVEPLIRNYVPDSESDRVQHETRYGPADLGLTRQKCTALSVDSTATVAQLPKKAFTYDHQTKLPSKDRISWTDMTTGFVHQNFDPNDYDLSSYQSVVGLVSQLHDNITTIVTHGMIDNGLLHLLLYSHKRAATDLKIAQAAYFDPVKFTTFPIFIENDTTANNNTRFVAWVMYRDDYEVYMMVIKYVRTTLLTIFGKDIFADIKDSNTGFRNVHPRAMLREIYTHHAVLNGEDVAYINTLANEPINTTLGAPIAAFAQNQQRAHELSQDTRNPLNEEVLANNLHQAYARLDFENARSSYTTYARLDESLKNMEKC